MRVYLLTESCDYEGSTVLGVYGTEEKAVAAVENISRRHLRRRGETSCWDCWGGSIFVEEHDVE